MVAGLSVLSAWWLRVEVEMVVADRVRETGGYSSGHKSVRGFPIKLKFGGLLVDSNVRVWVEFCVD